MMPISTCQITKAMRGDTAVFKQLVIAMEHNLQEKKFDIVPCRHRPPCPNPTPKQLLDFDTKVRAAIKERAELRRREETAATNKA